jgi:hypothetical protein
MSKHNAKIAGLVAGGGTGASLVGATAALSGPAANLGGYAVAQVVAGSVGLGGPALSVGIAAVGGPVVAGARCRRRASVTARTASPSGSSDEGEHEHAEERVGEVRGRSAAAGSRRAPSSGRLGRRRRHDRWRRGFGARRSDRRGRSVPVSAAQSASLLARSPAREARDEQPRALVGRQVGRREARARDRWRPCRSRHGRRAGLRHRSRSPHQLREHRHPPLGLGRRRVGELEVHAPALVEVLGVHAPALARAWPARRRRRACGARPSRRGRLVPFGKRSAICGSGFP